MGEHAHHGGLYFDCPLCGHAEKITPQEELMCPYCGAELHIFEDRQAANQFAEVRKAANESTAMQQVKDGKYWVVGHKWTPPGQDRAA